MKMDEPLAIQIRRVPVSKIIDLRHRVLRAGLARTTAQFAGDDAAGSVHLAAITGKQIIGCTTLHPSEFEGQPAFQLRGMAVALGQQRRGVGQMLLAESERISTEAGKRFLWANCRTPAVPFYKKNGWNVVSEEFEITSAGPHFRMVREI
jgi:predicted GNAT family N-acyltransferase